MLPKAKRLELIERFENRPTLESLAKEYGLTKAAVAMILFRARQSRKKVDSSVSNSEKCAGLKQEG